MTNVHPLRAGETFIEKNSRDNRNQFSMSSQELIYDAALGLTVYIETYIYIFFYQDLVATTGVPDIPFAVGSHRPKNLKNPKKERKKKN